MKQSTRWILIAVAGLLLLFGPTALRYLQRSAPATAYAPPDIPTAAIAATPIPTATPMPLVVTAAAPTAAMKRGPVVVDLAHYSVVDRNRFQPMASALAEHGLDLRFWLPSVAMDDVQSFTDFPDQSESLQKTLADASAFVVVSPYFLYTDREVQVVARFLADGGRLLIISDPDIESDAARDTNSLSAPFNVVFNEDYLYDTVDNDENYTYFFQGGFFDQAADLADSRIAFYGGRSIDGGVVPQVRSAATTLSSLRTGQSGFTTAAIGGLQANHTLGHVLALSDLDVLTDPYVARHDNRRMLEFVVSFLSDGARNQTIADFPAFLGNSVTLVVEGSDAVGAQALSKAAELQQVLELSGRTLQLGATKAFTDSVATAGSDVIYVAHYDDANRATTLLSDAGFALEERVITPTLAAPGSTPVAGPTEAPAPGTRHLPDGIGIPEPDKLTPVPEIPTSTPAPDVPTALPTPETTPLTLTAAPGNQAAQEPTPTPEAASTLPPALPTPPATPDAAVTSEGDVTPEGEESRPPQPTPTIQVNLVRGDGIRLLADETQLFIQRAETDGRKTVAVLGAGDGALNAGLTRLLNRDLSGCLIQDELVICPYAPGASTTTTTAAPATQPDASAAPDKKPVATPQPETSSPAIIVVDDDRNAAEGEIGEAELYAALLASAGYAPTLWSTKQSGYPETDILSKFAWVIWSDADYSKSGVRGDALRIIGDVINSGGKVTIGSRMPFFGVSAQPASPIADVVITDGVPELVAGLPADPIVLREGLPDVTPLDSNPEPSTGATIAMRRGPTSTAADAPVLMLYTDENFDEPKGAKLLLFGMSLNWLPDDVSAQLVQNMAKVMLAE